MTEQLKNSSPTIQRAVVLDNIRALYLTQFRFNRFLKEDSYACGYREGFEDALLAMAQAIGVSAEFENIKKQTASLETGSLTIYPQNSR